MTAGFTDVRFWRLSGPSEGPAIMSACDPKRPSQRCDKVLGSFPQALSLQGGTHATAGVYCRNGGNTGNNAAHRAGAGSQADEAACDGLVVTGVNDDAN